MVDNSSLSTRELEARMRPGVLSQAGFLGEHEQLDEVLTRDAQTLAELDITYEEIAEQLDQLLRTAVKGGQRISRVSDYEVAITCYSGFQICPWSPDIHHSQCMAGGGVRYASIDWEIHNLRSGQTMRGPGLIVHLIRAHRFFEGVESPYRIDPRELARLLGFSPCPPSMSRAM